MFTLLSFPLMSSCLLWRSCLSQDRSVFYTLSQKKKKKLLKIGWCVSLSCRDAAGPAALSGVRERCLPPGMIRGQLTASSLFDVNPFTIEKRGKYT